MAFGIGINNENQDAGMIRGSQQDIACECWFTQKGKMVSEKRLHPGQLWQSTAL